MADLNGGIKGAAEPCGGAKAAVPAGNTYAPGSTVMVEIEETITHPGHYELHWSSDNDATFTVMAGMDNIVNPPNVLEKTKVALTLPATLCDNCTLQLRMVMTEVPANPVNYYSCADIRLGTVPAMDLGAVDMAGAPDSDMATSTTGGNDLGASAPGDMTTKPPAKSVGLPGCNVGGNGSPFTLFSILFAIGLVALPRLQLSRRRR